MNRNQHMGIFTAAGDENKSPELLEQLRIAGAALTDPDKRNEACLVIRAGNVTVRAPLNQTQAVRAVQEWLDAHPQAQLTVVFNVFTAQDETLYQQLLY